MIEKIRVYGTWFEVRGVGKKSFFEGSLVLKICLVGKFNEGASRQGRFVVGPGGCISLSIIV